MSGDHLVGVSLSRTHKRHEFEAHQVRAATLLLPHFAQARRQKLALHHQSSGQIHPAEGARAMASQDGCLMFSSGAVVALLQTEWPQWEPPVLPRELMLTLAHTSPPSYVGREIHITAMPFGRALNVCVQQRRKVPVLSAAQLNVARLTTRGLTHKEVARELNLSAHTVRNHLAAIYQKLAVRNKTELAAKWRP